MPTETPIAIVYLLLVAGFLAGFLVRQFSRKFIDFLRYNWLRFWMATRADKDAVFEFQAEMLTTIRYVASVKAIGTAMVKQYRNAQSVNLFFGDCDFLDHEENERLLHRLEEFANLGALTAYSSESFSALEDKYHERAPRRNRIYALLEKLNLDKRFQHRPGMKFRGSFVDYGVGYAIYRFQTISSDGSIYPAVIINISSSSVIQFANKEISVASTLDTLIAEKFDR